MTGKEYKARILARTSVVSFARVFGLGRGVLYRIFARKKVTRAQKALLMFYMNEHGTGYSDTEILERLDS